MGDQVNPSSHYDYDLFISYNRADRSWVWDKLLPRLEAVQLRVLTPDRDFIPGWPRRRNIDRAVAISRHTVAVLTPAFVKDDWDILATMAATDDDPLALRLKLLPLLLIECQLPETIAALSLEYLDFTDERNWEGEFERLIRTVKTPLPEQPPPRIIKVLGDWINILSSARNLLRLSLATLILVSVVLLFQLPSLLPEIERGIEKARQPPDGWLCPFWPAPIHPMPDDGTFNIAVAPFTRLDDADDASILTQDIQYLSQRLYVTIDRATKTKDLFPSALPVKVRPPEEVRIACGQAAFDPDPNIRGMEATDYAEANRVHLLIYGVITGTHPNYFVEPEFYVSKELDDDFNYGSEIIGSERLGSRVPLNLPLGEPENWFDTQKKLHARSLALQYIIAGLAYFYVNEYEDAWDNFQEAAGIADWSDNEGKEVVYLLMGAAKLRAYGPRIAPDRGVKLLDDAWQSFLQACHTNPLYARNYLGLGAVAYQQAILVNPANRKKLIEAENWYSRSLLLLEQPEAADASLCLPSVVPLDIGHLPWSSGTPVLMAKIAYGLAQVQQSGFSLDSRWSKEQAHRFFTEVTTTYTLTPTADLAWFAGHAHAQLGWLAGSDKNWQAMLSEEQEAIKILKSLARPPEDWLALYLSWLGVAQANLGQIDEACLSFRQAIELGEQVAGPQVRAFKAKDLEGWRDTLKLLEKGKP